jgi:hypothetical protein
MPLYRFDRLYDTLQLFVSREDDESCVCSGVLGRHLGVETAIDEDFVVFFAYSPVQW